MKTRGNCCHSWRQLCRRECLGYCGDVEFEGQLSQNSIIWPLPPSLASSSKITNLIAINCLYMYFFLFNTYFYLAMPGLSYSMWDLVPWPRIEPRPLALGAQSLSHWTTGKSLCMHFWNIYFSYLNVSPRRHTSSFSLTQGKQVVNLSPQFTLYIIWWLKVWGLERSRARLWPWLLHLRVMMALRGFFNF